MPGRTIKLVIVGESFVGKTSVRGQVCVFEMFDDGASCADFVSLLELLSIFQASIRRGKRTR